MIIINHHNISSTEPYPKVSAVLVFHPNRGASSRLSVATGNVGLIAALLMNVVVWEYHTSGVSPNSVWGIGFVILGVLAWDVQRGPIDGGVSISPGGARERDATEEEEA